MPETSMIVALVADTHGFLDPRVAAIARSAGLVVHAGDIGARSILDELATDGARVLAVTGNNDDSRHWPESDLRLPGEIVVELPGGALAVEHGHRFPARTRHRRLRRAYPEAAAVVCGHSHRQAVDRDELPWILNPGAAGRSRAHGGPGCLVLHAAPAGWHVESHRFEPLTRRG